MFISRPSDPHTVLLWGDRWWFPGTGSSLPFDDLAHSVEVLVTHFADEPKPVRLRLIFQSDALESVAVACPQGDRATLAAALAGEYSALANPGCAWSYEPILPIGGDHSTLLHFENQPGLKPLATELARNGLAVEAVWPLVSFLHALPSEWTETGAITVMAVQSCRAVAFRHAAEGSRSALRWNGTAAVSDAAEWIAEILGRNAEEPVLLVCADEEASTTLGSFTGAESYPAVEQVSLGEALGRPVIFPRYHPAQLLPRPAVFTAARAMIAASVAILLATGWVGVSFARERWAQRQNDQSRLVQLQTLRSEVAHLRDNAAEIAGLRRSLEGGAAGPPCGAWLAQIAATQPVHVTLTSLQITGRTISLVGWIAPGTPRTVLEEWRSRLVSAGGEWALDGKAGSSGPFNLTGGFKS